VVALRSTLANNFHLVWSVYRESCEPCIQDRVAPMVRRSRTVSSPAHKWRSSQHCHTASVLSPNNRELQRSIVFKSLLRHGFDVCSERVKSRRHLRRRS
jgi:hypothetical protein